MQCTKREGVATFYSLDHPCCVYRRPKEWSVLHNSACSLGISRVNRWKRASDFCYLFVVVHEYFHCARFVVARTNKDLGTSASLLLLIVTSSEQVGARMYNTYTHRHLFLVPIHSLEMFCMWIIVQARTCGIRGVMVYATFCSLCKS